MNIKSLSREQIMQTAAYYLGFISMGLVMVSTGPHLQNLVEHTHSTIEAFGIVFTISAIGFLVGSLIGGWFYDRIKGHIIITICFITMALSMAVMPLISSIWVMSGVMLINTLAMSLIDLGSNTLLTWVHGENGAPFMNALHFFFGVGATISPLLIGKLITTTGDIYWSYWTLGLLTVPVIIFFLFVKSPAIRREEDASPNETQSQLKGRPRTTFIILLVMYFLLYVGTESNFGNYIVSFIQATGMGATEEAAYQINSLFWGMLTVGRFLAIPISSVLKPRDIITIDIIGCIVAFVVILVFRNSVVAMWIGAGLLGFAEASMFPTALTYAEKNLRLTGRITSYFYLGIGASNMFFTWFIAQFFESRGPISVMVILAAMVVLQALNWVWIVNTTRKKQPSPDVISEPTV